MQPDLEELHREASTHYLNGEFEAAMAAWRRVVSVKPDDERAREGLRLCEHLAGGIDPSQCEVMDAPCAPEGAPPVSAQPTHEPAEMPDLDVAIDLPPKPTATGPSPEAAKPPPPAHDLPPRDAEPPAKPAPLFDTGPPSGPPPDPSAAASGAEAAATPAEELRRRVDDLLCEARELAEAGDTNGALRTLERVLILDEDNASAVLLREAIAVPTVEEEEPGVADLAPGAGDADPTKLAEAGSEQEPVQGLDLGALDVDGTGDVPVSLPEEGLADDEGAGAPSEDDAATEDGSAAPPAGRWSFASLPSWARDRRVQIGAAGLCVVLIVVVALQMAGGGAASTTEPLQVRTRTPAAAPRGPVAPETAPAEAEPPPDAPVEPVDSDLATLLREGNEAFEAENYAAAVIAYNQVLKRVPDHREAGVRMEVAAERYRLQQERQERWDRAVEAFEQQNYAEALRLFYRMPENEYEADIRRFKVNGWYNLGVAALQTKDCRRAIEHFEEALAIRPDDAGVLAALRMAELCRGPAVLQDMRRLSYRALND